MSEYDKFVLLKRKSVQGVFYTLGFFVTIIGADLSQILTDNIFIRLSGILLIALALLFMALLIKDSRKPKDLIYVVNQYLIYFNDKGTKKSVPLKDIIDIEIKKYKKGSTKKLSEEEARHCKFGKLIIITSGGIYDIDNVEDIDNIKTKILLHQNKITKAKTVTENPVKA